MDELQQRKTKQKLILRSVIAVVLILALMITLIAVLRRYVEKSVHTERENYLTAQTQTSAGLIDRTIAQYSDFADVCGNVISGSITGGESLGEYVDELGSQLRLEGAQLILVDAGCTWYGEDGTSGRITAVSNYESDTPNKVIYITKGVDADVESIVFRVRLDHPVSLYAETGLVQIAYCAVISYMDTLHDQVAAAFPYACNRFIVDDTGLMLYKDFELGILMGGSNIFSKYARASFIHGDSGAEQLEELRQGKAVAGEFELNGESYFICTAPLEVNGWSLTYVLKSEELLTGGYIQTIFLYVSIIFLLFAAAIIVAFLLLLRSRNDRRQMDVHRQANAYLEQAAQAKTAFLANMSHDIRTPINGIMGLTILAQKENNPPKTVECLNKMDETSRHLLALVNDVLDMSSIESGKLAINNKPVLFRSIPDHCVSIIQGQMEGRQLMLITQFDELTHPALMADSLHLRQVLINILSNAVKYTKDGGTIWFTMKELLATENDVLIRFKIMDTGIGMKPEFLDRIWDSFAQEDGGARSNFNGTGLGMTITKQLVELMGGTIEVRSVYEQGSTFTVDLPFVPTTLETPEQTETEVSGDIRDARILLVDDNELNRMIAQELLEDEGAIVTTEDNGRKALERFEASQPGEFDIILMDIMMPEMDGLEASRRIRALDRPDAQTIPLIAMTANAFEWDIQKSRDAGMNAHLSKPIDLPVLLKTLSGYYHRKEG